MPLSWTEDEKTLIKDLEHRLADEIKPWYKDVLKKDWSHITTIKKVGIGGRLNPNWVHRRGKDYLELEQDIEYFYALFKKELEKEINNFISTEIEWIPLNNINVSKEKNEALINFFETLEEDDDVQNIYTNAKFTK